MYAGASSFYGLLNTLSKNTQYFEQNQGYFCRASADWLCASTYDFFKRRDRKEGAEVAKLLKCELISQ